MTLRLTPGWPLDLEQEVILLHHEKRQALPWNEIKTDPGSCTHTYVCLIWIAFCDFVITDLHGLYDIELNWMFLLHVITDLHDYYHSNRKFSNKGAVWKAELKYFPTVYDNVTHLLNTKIEIAPSVDKGCILIRIFVQIETVYKI